MSDMNLSLLDALPEAVLRLDGGSVAYRNEAARRLLPALEEGKALPPSMEVLNAAVRGAGVFVEWGQTFSFSVSRAGGERLVLLRSAPAPVLTARELDGAVCKLRGLLGDLAAEAGPITAPGAGAPGPGVRADLTKSWFRMARLVNDLDYVRLAAGADGVPFRPVTMDLAGLCREVAQRAGDLLRCAGATLWYDAQTTSLLIPGDPALLRRLLLGLISNSARAAGRGSVTLSLRLQGDRAVLTLTDSGKALGPRERDALFQQGSGGEAPVPGQGAGLGLSIARDIAALHKGALLVDLGEGDVPVVLISLPTGPLDAGVTVRTPAADEDGGLDPYLLELSDVLPAGPYGEEGLE